MSQQFIYSAAVSFYNFVANGFFCFIILSEPLISFIILSQMAFSAL